MCKSHAIAKHRFILTVFLLFGLASAVYCVAFPQDSIWGDEIDYLRASNTLPSINGYIPRQVPGALPYYWWPPFASAFYSLFSTDSLKDFYAEHPVSRRKTLNPPQRHFLRRTAGVNVLLLGLSGWVLYCISNLCGLGKSWSSIAVALTLLNPRVLFYEQALWPELLHLLLLGSAVLFLFLFIQKRSIATLFLSSLFFSYASFTKSVADLYIFLVSILLFFYYLKSLNLAQVLKYTAALLIPFLLLTNAQKMRNLFVHDHYAIASNTWINIEAGLIPAEEIRADGYESVYERYQKAARTPHEKERLSRSRIVEFLASADASSVIKHQVKNYGRLINHSFLDDGITKERWAHSQQLKAVLPLKNSIVWLSVIAGALGVCIFAFRNIYCGVLALFLAYYLSALLILGFNARLMVQALPFLAIFTCFTMKSGMNLLRNFVMRPKPAQG
jgi:hypothetical protein